MITRKEIIERFKNAVRLYEETQNLSERREKHLEVINRNRTYSYSLIDIRDFVSRSGGVNITWYKGLNRGVGIAYNEFDKLFDTDNSIHLDKLKVTVLDDVYNVKALCQELSYIESWLINIDSENYKKMDAYLQEYNSCPFCGYLSYDQTRCVDENFREYLDRIQEDLNRAIEVLPTLYNHLDNTKITLEQRELI